MVSTGDNWCFRSRLVAGLACSALWTADASAVQPASKPNAARKAPANPKERSAPPHRKRTSPADADDRAARRTLELALENYQTTLEVIANNIANADTPGYKQSHALLVDFDYRDEIEPGVQDASGEYSPDGLSVGTGSRVVGTEIDFRQGRLRHTGRQWDMAIQGDGFFQVKDPSGNIYYCRAGHFAQNCNGQIAVEAADSGRLLEPAITIPNDATRVVISPEGTVSYRTPTSATLQQAGTIQLAGFINPQGLRRIGENLYAETDGCGTATTGTPGANSFGKLRQGWIEESQRRSSPGNERMETRAADCRELRALLEDE